jgi:hypothetical protein
MLTAATLGMFAYGLYSLCAGLWDLLVTSRLELLAVALLVGLGSVLMLAAPFVRVRLAGGVELAAAAMLALQGLALHNAAHTEAGITIVPQLLRGLFALALLTVGFARGRPESAPEP